MKKAQSLVEYALLTGLTIVIAVGLLHVLSIDNAIRSTILGIGKSGENNEVDIPSMISDEFGADNSSSSGGPGGSTTPDEPTPP